MAEKFHFRHGKTASNSEDLKKILPKISQDEFNHHVNDHKNDFANWLEHIGEKSLASKIKGKKTKTEMLKEITATTTTKKTNNTNKTRNTGKESTSRTKSEKTTKAKKTTTKTAAKKSSSKQRSSKTQPGSSRKTYNKDNTTRSNLKDSERIEKEIRDHLEKQTPNKRYIPDTQVSYISTEGPHTFILKEFLMGALFGLLLGLILMAMLSRSTVYF